jgi:hypothetical protein
MNQVQTPLQIAKLFSQLKGGGEREGEGEGERERERETTGAEYIAHWWTTM